MHSKLFIVLFVLFATPSIAQDIDISCNGSPDQAVLEIPKPANTYVHIICTKFGHVINPVTGWFWTKPGTFQPQFFPAQMVRSGPKEVGNAIYFDSVVVNELSGELVAEKWSIFDGMFDETDGSPTQALEIVATSSMGSAHTLYIFPNKFGYSCSPTCRVESSFIMISEANEDVSW